MLLYSFMVKGDYGDVKFWQFSSEGWFGVFLQRDIFDDTLAMADAHLADLLALGEALDRHHPSDTGLRIPDSLFHRDAAASARASCGCS